MQIEIIQQILKLLSFKDYTIDAIQQKVIIEEDPRVIITIDDKNIVIMNENIPLEVISKIKRYSQNKIFFSELLGKGCYTHITDSIKSILIILSYLKDYYDEMEGKDATCVQKIDENKTKLNTWLLEQMNPSLTLDEWLNTQSMDVVKKSIKNDNRTTLGRYFRKTLTDFDKAVNPYLDASISLKDCLDIEKIADFDWNKEGILLLGFTNLESNIKTRFLRSNLRFLCHFSMATDPNHKIELAHDIVTVRGEKVIFYLENNEQKEEYTYNLTEGTIEKDGVGTDSFPSRPMTPLERDQLYDQLVQAKKMIDGNLIPKIQKENPALQYVYRNPKTNKRPTS